MVAAGWPAWTAQVLRPHSLEQIDAALRESIAKQPLQSVGLAAYQAILPSVVRVVGEPPAAASAPGKKLAKAGKPVVPAPESDDADPHEGRSVGTGVVIVDKGLILTNLHVVDGAAKITITFADGSQSEARVVNLMPENDLAVLQALTIPDDLHAATMRSTSGLAPGEAVMAVGFPFGIGPSASQGVVSGLKREFRSPEGRRILNNLIQFDAAANPGNSGGPLITMDGHVVGIVTAIMNPNDQRTFIGIGFAVPIENAAAGAGLLMAPF
jgi:S1-C subfamily serine protease